jgi:hypothetical protein
VPAGRLPGRHCGGPEGAVGPLQPLNEPPRMMMMVPGILSPACLLAVAARGGLVVVYK